MISLSQPLVLASTSAPRCSALKRLQIPFLKASPNDVDESPKPNETAIDLVKRLAQLKATSVAPQHPTALIIGGDQVADLEGVIMGKPQTHSNAVHQLLQCSGKKVYFHHGLCLLNATTQHTQLAVETTTVYFRPLTRNTIERYLARDKPYQCAGSLMAESLGVSLVERIDTHDPHSLFGLPLIHLVSLLEKAGVDILG